METINMGLNTEPIFELPSNFNSILEDSKEPMKRERERALKLREEIHQVMSEDGECRLSWECSGRQRHAMHANQWADALPEYDFTIGYNYMCVVKLKEAQ